MKFLSLCLIALIAPLAAQESPENAPAGWTEDFAAATGRANERDSMIVLAFLGTDWSGWCAKMKADVFDKPDFLEGAAAHYELVLADFPRDRDKQDAAIREQNAGLKEKYGVKGHPTVLFLDGEGRVYDSDSYNGADVEGYLKRMDRARQKQLELAKAAERAATLEGREKVRELVKVERLIPQDYQKWFPTFYEQMEAEDPGDRWGILQRWQLDKTWKAKQNEIVRAFRSADYPNVVKLADTYIDEVAARGAFAQEISLAKIYAQGRAGQYEAATKSAEEALALEPESHLAAQLGALPGEIEELKKQMAARAEIEQVEEAKPEEPAEVTPAE